MHPIHMVFRFLFFYRRIFYGIVILAGLVYWLTVGKDQFANWLQNREPRPSQDLGVRSLPDLAPPVRPLQETKETTPSIESDVTTSPSLESTKNLGGRSAFKQLLASSDINQLIKESLRLGAAAANENKPMAFLQARHRKELFQRLNEMELSESQRKYVVRGLLETLSILDSLNLQANLRADNVRLELMEKVPHYLNDSDKDVASLAALVLTVSPGVDFLANASVEKLNRFEEAFDIHFESISNNSANRRKLADLIWSISQSAVYEKEATEFFQRAIERFAVDDSPEGQIVYRRLQSHYYLDSLKLESLVDRVNRIEFDADGDVRRLFNALKSFPEASVEIYQTALDVIREFIKQGKKERAADLIHEFEEEIGPRIEPEEKQSKILRALNELKSFL